MATNFLANNYIGTAAMLTPTRQAESRLTGVTRSQQGGAVFARGGVYTGATDRLYVVEILSVALNGTFDPLTTFRWSDDGGLTWSADQSITVSGAAFALSFGVQISWSVSGALPEFVVDDHWSFQGRRPYGVTYLLDGDRHSEFRTDPLATSDVAEIRVDFGTALTPTAAILQDHNVLATTPVVFQGSAVANFSTTLVNITMAWRAGILIAVAPTNFVAKSARYWRWVFTAASGQSDIRISEVYLGDKTTMSIAFRLGFSEDRRELASTPREVLARGTGPATLAPKSFEIEFGQLKDGTGLDREKLEAVWALTNHLPTRTRRPFWFIPNDANLANTYLMHWEGDFQLDNRSDAIYGPSGALYSSPIRLIEVVRAA